MIEEAFSLYADISKKVYPAIIILSIIIAIVAMQEATKTEISTDIINFFYPDTPGWLDARKIESDFMGTDSVSILIEADRFLSRDVLSEDMLGMTADIVDTMSTIPGVFQVTSILDLGNSREEIMQKPYEKVSKYLSRNYEYSLIEIRLDSAEVADRTKLIESFQKTLDRIERAKGAKVTLAGGLTTFYVWDQAVKSGFVSSIVTSAITVVIILLLVYRSFITSFFMMVPVIIAVIAAFGMMHMINIPLNFLTVMFGSVTLGLGIDYSIHLTDRYYEEIEKGKSDAINIALSKVGRNTIFASLTTMAAFSSMAIAGLRMVAEYGFMSFVAITFSALSVLLFLPSFLIFENKIGRRTFDTARLSNALGMRGILTTFMTKISDYAISKPFGVILFVSIALIPAFYGMSNIGTMTDGDMWLPQDTPAIKANKIIDKEFGEYVYTMILVESDDIRTPEIMSTMIDVENAIRDMPHVVEVSSIASRINTSISNNEKDIEAKLSELPIDIRRQYITKDYTEALILIKADDKIDPNIFYNEIDDIVNSIETPADATFIHAGLNKLFSKTEGIMEKDQAETTMASLILVIVLIYFALRGFAGVIIGLTPVLLAIIFAMGIMGLLDIPSTPLTIMIATLLLGLGIDYSIHFISRYKEERKNGYPLEKSLVITSSTVGESLAITSITTIFGFLSLITMTLIPVQDFGKVAAIGLFLCTIFVPIIVPVGLMFQERIVSRALLWLPLPWRRGS